MSLISDIATQLQTVGVGTVGTNIFYSLPPDSPDSLVAVLDTGGSTPDPYLPTHEPTFQVYVRATSYTAGKSKVEDVRTALHQKSGVTYGSTFFFFILAFTEAIHIGVDEQGRDEFTINFRCRTR